MFLSLFRQARGPGRPSSVTHATALSKPKPERRIATNGTAFELTTPSVSNPSQPREPSDPGRRTCRAHGERGAIPSVAPPSSPAIPVMITFRLGFPERRYQRKRQRPDPADGAVGFGGRSWPSDRDPIPRPWRVICVRAHAHGVHSGRGERIQRAAAQRHRIPPSLPPAHCRGKRPKESGRRSRSGVGADRSDGEVHAQVQAGGGGRGGRRGGHAGRRRPDPVAGGRGQRRRLQEEEAAAARLAPRRRRRSCPERELLPQAPEPHAVHGPAGLGLGVGCWPRARARGAAAIGRPLALLQHGVVRGRVGGWSGQEPAVVRLRRCCQGRRPGGLGKQQRGGRRQPREARDDAVQPFPGRPERPGVGSGGPEQRPVVAAANADHPSSGRREGEDPAGSRDRGVLRGRRGGRGQALRLQVQLRRGPRRASGLRPVRVVPGGEQQLASHLKASERARA